MIAQVTFGLESFVAALHQALVWSIIAVVRDVPGESAALPESPSAAGPSTFEWTSTGENATMFDEVAVDSECFAALRAIVWLLASVHANVAGEVAPRHECFVATGPSANVLLVIVVPTKMIAQLTALAESFLASPPNAMIGTLSSVNATMAGEVDIA